jgi:hypothetical protein
VNKTRSKQKNRASVFDPIGTEASSPGSANSPIAAAAGSVQNLQVLEKGSENSGKTNVTDITALWNPFAGILDGAMAGPRR